jgi:Cu2+-containing amine oxidase
VVKKERMRIAKTAARIRSDVALLLALLALLFSAPRAVASQRRHPLDGLSADEYRAVVDILASGGLVTPDSRFHQISLEEPPKSYVKSFLLRDGADGDGVADGGLPIPRAAVAYVRSSPGRTHKAEVDLSSRTVLSWEASDPPAGQPMVLSEEFFGAGEIAKVDVRMVAGLAKRDLSPDDVYCVPFSAGTYGNPDEEGHRLLKVNCYAVPDRSDGNEKGNWWAMPIQGLFVVFDLNTNTALDVVDTGVVPVPSDPWGYTAAEVEERYGRRPVAVTREEGGGRSLPSSPSASSTPPADAGYVIDGSVVSWDFWRFHYRVDRRPGVILSLVEVNDGGTWRDVAYEVHLSEVFVPYMDLKDAARQSVTAPYSADEETGVSRIRTWPREGMSRDIWWGVAEDISAPRRTRRRRTTTRPDQHPRGRAPRTGGIIGVLGRRSRAGRKRWPRRPSDRSILSADIKYVGMSMRSNIMYHDIFSGKYGRRAAEW